MSSRTSGLLSYGVSLVAAARRTSVPADRGYFRESLRRLVRLSVCRYKWARCLRGRFLLPLLNDHRTRACRKTQAPSRAVSTGSKTRPKRKEHAYLFQFRKHTLTEKKSQSCIPQHAVRHTHTPTSKTLTMVPFSITPMSIEKGSASSLILSGLRRRKAAGMNARVS